MVNVFVKTETFFIVINNVCLEFAWCCGISFRHIQC